MDFYSTVTHRSAPASESLVGGVFAPGGQLQLGIPLQPEPAGGAAAAAAAPGGGGSALAAAPSGGVLVLMHPTAPSAESAPRVMLHAGIAADVATAAVMLAELRWRTVQATALIATGAAALAIAAVGAVGCHLRAPRLLDLFALAAFSQFLICGLLALSLPELFHCALQPFLVWNALRLRSALLPLWFSTGRTRPSSTWPGMR